MANTPDEEKKAVECGYWHLYRYNPELKESDKNPFILDSKAPKGDFREFLMGEIRYSSLAKAYPEKADELFALTEKYANDRYRTYKRLSDEFNL